MKTSDLMSQILEILPNAVFGEEQATGEIVIATGLRENTAGELIELDSDEE
jgi:hypothetical protein